MKKQLNLYCTASTILRVQGVRLALAHHQVPTTLTSVPFGFGWFLRYGVVFPALQLADGTRMVDPLLYERLDQLGF